jgi:Bacterial regulatory helix-turn-helix protein, lysR family
MQWDDRIGRRLRLKALHMLQTVAELGSMGTASQRLALSQPAISKAVSAMEQTLGTLIRELRERSRDVLVTFPSDPFLGRVVRELFHRRRLPLPPTVATTISIHIALANAARIKPSLAARARRRPARHLPVDRLHHAETAPNRRRGQALRTGAPGTLQNDGRALKIGATPGHWQIGSNAPAAAAADLAYRHPFYS